MNEGDFASRAFIWGTTVFRLDDAATFKIVDGVRSIVGATMVPDDTDNFDFDGHPSIQAINDAILRPMVDPYNIGRTVEFTFDPLATAAWVSSHSSDEVFAADDNRDIGTFGHSLADLAFTPALLAAYAATVLTLDVEIAEAVEYYKFEDRNVIYGSPGDDVIDASSLSLLYYDPLVSRVIVAGDGDDEITSITDGDEIFAGTGDDGIHLPTAFVTVHGGDGDDHVDLWNNGATVYGGAGADTLEFTDGQDQGQADWFLDATTDDRIALGPFQLTGQYLANVRFDSSIPVVYQDVNGDFFDVISVDDFAAYDLFSYVADDGPRTQLTANTTAGHQLHIEDYAPGVAGISAVARNTSYFTTDIGLLTGNRFVFLDPGDESPYPGNLENYVGFHNMPIEYVGAPVG